MNEMLVVFEEFPIFTPEISENIDKRKIDAYLLHAARFDLSELIGGEMYADLIDNQALPQYADLINGGGYYCEKKYYGIKPYLCYSAYVRMISESATKMTAVGIVKKNLDYSEHVKGGELKTQIDIFSQKANFYAQGILGYLRENRGVFPKFKCVFENNQVQTQMMQVVKGLDKYPPSGGAWRYENSY